jgi:hypothetical protein
MLNRLIYSKHKSEGDCTSNDSCIRYEDKVLETNATLIPKKLAYFNDSNSADEAAAHANNEHANEELP